MNYTKAILFKYIPLIFSSFQRLRSCIFFIKDETERAKKEEINP